MTNSAWTAEYVRRAYGSQRVYVVHPPVNDEELSTLGGNRGRIVLTVSGIYPEKNVLAIADVAKLVPEAEFYLVGATGPVSGPILRELKRRSEGLRNFHLETDVPRSRILELMSQASVYLDPPVAEAAASGLVPVVYRDGGGWTDIASRIDQGLGYASVEEAAHIVCGRVVNACPQIYHVPAPKALEDLRDDILVGYWPAMRRPLCICSTAFILARLDFLFSEPFSWSGLRRLSLIVCL
jgi:glycosyltransferase involved in cell wall biosynthesis